MPTFPRQSSRPWQAWWPEAALSSETPRRIIRRLLRVPEPSGRPYGERLSELTASLTRSSAEVDLVLRELAQVARDREAAARKLETGLSGLEAREKDLKQRIEILQETPIPVAEHFAKLLQSGERRSARRDYVLFGAGVVVTTGITIAIQLFSKR